MQKLFQKQTKLAKKIIAKDILTKKIRTVAAINRAFSGNKIISASVVCSWPDLELIEKRFAIFKTDFPYKAGLLVYIEGPAIILSYKKLKAKPDILLINASGICHPRFLGLASHVGLLLNVATIGITKSLLCGEEKNNKIYFKNKLVGYKLKNIYISPGHKISLSTAIKIVKSCLKGHKLPEPLYLAHQYANEIKIKTNKSLYKL